MILCVSLCVCRYVCVTMCVSLCVCPYVCDTKAYLHTEMSVLQLRNC